MMGEKSYAIQKGDKSNVKGTKKKSEIEKGNDGIKKHKEMLTKGRKGYERIKRSNDVDP